MATELGQAYVQIMPSAKGISGSIQKQLDPEATSAGKSAGSKIGTGIKIAAIAAVAAAGVAIGKVISSSISEGAKLEQSLGGIDTLFKDSAGKVKKYADEAYRTAGLSANAYMENVTGFSASLLQSMGGDTEKAADKANMAMVDMSDNANKMGTNIGDIQNAYQGFAKQNYTMLDNLKLGYGGTQEEMKRLLADATKISGVKYDMSNLADVYDAIHVIQGELDITGTTAKEAAETFSGSFAAMKASLQNVLGNMAIGADLTDSLNALAETTSTFLFGNFIPMVGNILSALPGAIATFFKAAAPMFVSEGKNLLSSLGIGITSGTAGLFSSVLSALTPIKTAFQTVFGQLPGLFQTVVNAIQPVITTIANGFAKLDFSGLQTLISAIIPAVQSGFQTMMGIVGPAIDTVVNSFVKMWNAIQPLISILAGALMPAFQVFGSFIGGIFKGLLLGISGAFDLVTTAVTWLTPIFNFLVNAFKACAPALSTVAEWVGVVIGFFANFGSAGNGLKAIITSAWANIKTAISLAGSVIGSVINVIKQIFSSLGSAGGTLKSILSVAWNGIKTVISVVSNTIKTIINIIKSVFSSLGSSGNILKGILTTAWNGIKTVISTVSSAIKTIINTIKSVFSGLGSAGNGLKGVLSAAWNGIKSIISGVAGGIKSVISGIKSVFSGLASAGNTLKSGISSAWNGMQSAISSVAGGISGIIDGVKNTFNSLKNISLSGAGSAIMDGFLGGLQSAYGKVQDFVGGLPVGLKIIKALLNTIESY
ncbi:phage tail protein [Vagococcus xieshaowenii]|uniref:phage tail protein n=1 Tax=Vagococcus xieshaowenii TaxID=2562451 RepID=UPI001F526795